jgi:hypothetical protein
MARIVSARVGPVIALVLLFPLVACSDSPAEPGPGGLPSKAPLHFSHQAGFYEESFKLTLSSSLAGATIYYTVDGSEPDPARVISDPAWEALPVEERERTLVYSAPLDLGALAERPDEIALIPTTLEHGGEMDWQEPGGPGFRGTVVRARAIGKGRDSGVRTMSYFIDPEGRDRYSLPVLSIATGRAGFFGLENGIYVPGKSGGNFGFRGDEWERAAYLELFEPGGKVALSQGVGLRIHGGYSRSFPRKSLRLYARSEYGEAQFSYRFFRSKDQRVFKRLIVRNGGNDVHGALFRDAALQTLVQHLPFETQHYQPVIVFINGEYWGIHGLRDRYDDRHLSIRYGIGRDEIALLENNAEVEAGDPADADGWRDFNERAGAGTLRTRADFDAEMDVDGYLDYAITQIYAANRDWPQNNIMHWRYKGPPRGGKASALDGRWHWLMFDVDFSFGYKTTKETNLIGHLLGDMREPWSRHLFRGLMGVPEIRHEFLQRAAVHLETTFRPDRVRRQIDSIAALLDAEIDEHAIRWRRPASHGDWLAQLDIMHDFAEDRPAYFRQHIRAEFAEVTGEAVLTIAGVTGREGLDLHTLPLNVRTPGVHLAGGEWRGRLFTGIPVVIRATGYDLREAVLSGEFSGVRRAASEVSFIMEGEVRVTLR